MKIAEQDVLKQFAADKDLMTMLTLIRSLRLKDSWLAAGSVRNFIWNILSGKSGFDVETDVDVIFLTQIFRMRKRSTLKTDLSELTLVTIGKSKIKSICISTVPIPTLILAHKTP